MSKLDTFNVPATTHYLSAMVSGCPSIWKWLGNVETTLLGDQLRAIHIERPVFIAGLARSGSTILLEAVAANEGVVTHKYRDFPGLFTPYFWEQGQGKAKHTATPQERAHGDGLMVTPDSPEAMEEMIWMAFFPSAHDPLVTNVLDRTMHHPKFESFFRDHICKLLLARQGTRYASKENYNVSRFQYLKKVLPDARFVLPIRNPVNHIASLVKQHRLFCEGEQKYPRSLAHMQRVGHFEFGLDLRPINFGSTKVIEEIQEDWQGENSVRGWARYWAEVHRFVADQLEADPELGEATMVVRFEDLCDDPRETLTKLMDHCHFDNDAVVEEFAAKIAAPTYYRPDFSDEDLQVIADETRAVAERFEYCDAAVVRGAGL